MSKKKSQPNESEFMTLPEAAKYLRVSKETMYRWVKAKKLPYHRIGRKYFFLKGSLKRAGVSKES
jgi:excisionase family DNA binding protein